jgi:hypothetical protein
MAAPVIVSSQVPAGDTVKRFYDLLGQKPLRVPKLVNLGDARVLVTTDAITTGVVANLTTLFATQVAAGFVLFPNSTISIVRCRAYGRGADATVCQYIEVCASVLKPDASATAPVVTTQTAPIATTGQVLNTGGGTQATAVFSASTNDVVLTFGGSATAMNWVIDIHVDDPVGIAKGS